MPPAEETGLGSRGKGYRTVEFEGFSILVGKGDADNDRLTFGVAEPRDFWLHVAGPAGSHVIVRNPFGLDELPRPVAERAAQLAAWHSKARGARGKVEVHLCRVADVRKPRGFAPGQVLLKRWDSVKVYPKGLDEPDEE
jgi:predicted ribosome quality control (RQC) complex YloA/Tae2 family protein